MNRPAGFSSIATLNAERARASHTERRPRGRARKTSPASHRAGRARGPACLRISTLTI
jgi:hypothetical protein